MKNSVEQYVNETAKAIQYTGFFQSTLNGLKMAIHAPVSLLKALGKALYNLPINAVRASAALLKKSFEKVGSAVKKILSSMMRFVGSKITSGLKKVTSGIFGINKAANKTTMSMGRMLGMSLLFNSVFRGISAISNGIKEGMQNLAQYSGPTNTSISMLISSLETLKNSFAAAFSPILNVVAPILSRFISMISTAVNYVGMFIAAITGQKTYTRALGVQKDYAAGFENTAGAAEDAAERYLSPLDDLNKYNEESSKSSNNGNGGSGGISPADMFETVEVKSISFDSWGEAFDLFLSYLLDKGIPALRNALFKLANVVNDFSANLYEMFTFPGVLEKVQLLGIELANAFNDFVKWIDWAKLGAALGAGINLALQFMVNFIYTFDWMNLGASLATMVNNAISEIDAYAIGQFLFSKIKIGIELLAGFLLNLDMAQLAQAASQIVSGFFDSMTQTIQNIDWEQLGEQIKTFLVNIDWGGIATSVFTAIGAAFGVAVEFLWGLIKDAWKRVVDWWHETAFEDGHFTIQGLLDGIVDVIKSIGTWIEEHIFKPFMEGFQSVFGIHSPSTVMQEQGHFIVEGLLNGIEDLIERVREKFEKIKEIAIGKLLETKDGAVEKVTDMKDRLVDIISSIKEKFSSIFGQMVDIVRNPINNIIDFINSLLFAAQSMQNSIADAFNSLSIDMPGWLEKRTGYSSIGFNVGYWSAPSIPYLAQGAVIPPNKEFMAVLGDQKNGNNIEAPENLIRRIVREESGNGKGGTYNVTAQVNRRTLFNLVLEEGKVRRTITGKNPFEQI